MIRLIAVLAAAIMGLFAAPSYAHEVRPAYLEVLQDEQNSFTITWKQPVIGEMAIRLVPHLSNGWLDASPAEDFITSAYRIRTWRVRAAPESLVGRTVRVKVWIARSQTH